MPHREIRAEQVERITALADVLETHPGFARWYLRRFPAGTTVEDLSAEEADEVTAMLELFVKKRLARRNAPPDALPAAERMLVRPAAIGDIDDRAAYARSVGLVTVTFDADAVTVERHGYRITRYRRASAASYWRLARLQASVPAPYRGEEKGISPPQWWFVWQRSPEDDEV